MLMAGFLVVGRDPDDSSSILLGGALLGFCLSVISTAKLATPHGSLFENAILQVFATIGVFVLNLAISFPGCYLIAHLPDIGT